MMNQVKFWRLGLVLVALFVTQIAIAQKKESRTVSGFTELSVSGPFDVEIKQGNSESLEVEANSEIMEHIITEVKGSELNIYLKGKNGTWKWNKRWDNPKIYLSFKTLKEISVSASADVMCDGAFKAEDLELDASSAGDIKIKNLTAKSVECDANSGADIVIEGSAEKLVADASSGADIEADDFVVKVCRADASSGADISVHVQEDLDADASSGADIRYKGNPKKVRVDSSSGGDVHKKN